jgi:hypothetical protein
MTERITIRVVCETVDDHGIIIEKATAFVEGQGVRGVVEVPSMGNRSDAMAEAVRLACLRYDTREPHAYSPETIGSQFPRELPDTYQPDTLLGSKAGR